jgi:hypothetical protein
LATARQHRAETGEEFSVQISRSGWTFLFPALFLFCGQKSEILSACLNSIGKEAYMGGSGGGGAPTQPRGKSTRDQGGGGTGSDPGEFKDICLTIQEDVRLESPKPEVLVGLKPGDVLDLLTNAGRPPIKAVTSDGKTAGAVVTSSLETLLGCMNQGHTYIGTVQSIKGGMCIVRITHASP